MAEKIAVETLTLKGAIAHKVKKLGKAKVSNHKWIQTYEIFKGVKFNFYCERTAKQSQPIVSIGMPHRTMKGLILVAVDVSNGGIVSGLTRGAWWEKWVRIYTAHFCERYAERIMKANEPTFKIGSEGVMFSDIFGPVRITDTISERIDEIEL